MTNIILKEKPQYLVVPDVLINEFETIILEAYCDSGWHDLHNLTEHVDIFAVYSASYEETGDPYDFVDDDSRITANKLIIENRFPVLMEDVSKLLKYQSMFYSWMDVGTNGVYRYIGVTNMPVREVW